MQTSVPRPRILRRFVKYTNFQTHWNTLGHRFTPKLFQQLVGMEILKSFFKNSLMLYYHNTGLEMRNSLLSSQFHPSGRSKRAYQLEFCGRCMLYNLEKFDPSSDRGSFFAWIWFSSYLLRYHFNSSIYQTNF